MDFKGLSTLAGGFDEKKTAKARWDKCKDCTFLTALTSRCRKCGCFMKLKVKLKQAKCPIGIW
tara:strand:- start:486 stop:674 length:189 start_codon:yes stop_codon:yes gene_type:complete